MRPCAAMCSFLPPHILRHLAENGDQAQRENAYRSLETSAQIRGERLALGSAAAMLAVPAGEKRRSVYDAHQTRALPGTLSRSEGGPSNGDAASDEAYEGAGSTYDFFRKVYDRNSIDGRGIRLDSTVHYGVRFDNAQWNGRQMVYGDGDGRLFRRFTSCLEVIGHELTHGVTQYSAALEYADQPGALNEHFSDVFGVLVKQYALKQAASKADWLVGAGLLTSRVHGLAIRSMKAPGTAYDDPLLGRDPQPSHMRDFHHTHDDNGGVHINSGIPNHVFYLVASRLGGKAWETAGRIWYRTLTRKLQSRAQFRDCAQGTAEVASELFGAGSEPQRVVEQAWLDVGVSAAPVMVGGQKSGPRLPVRETYQPPAPAAELPPSISTSARRRRALSR